MNIAKAHILELESKHLGWFFIEINIYEFINRWKNDSEMIKDVKLGESQYVACTKRVFDERVYCKV